MRFFNRQRIEVAHTLKTTKEVYVTINTKKKPKRKLKFV